MVPIGETMSDGMTDEARRDRIFQRRTEQRIADKKMREEAIQRNAEMRAAERAEREDRYKVWDWDKMKWIEVWG